MTHWKYNLFQYVFLLLSWEKKKKWYGKYRRYWQF